MRTSLLQKLPRSYNLQEQRHLHPACVHKLSEVFFSSKVDRQNEAEFNKPDWIKFSHARHGPFYQTQPKLENPFLSDAPLQSFLNRHLPKEINKEIFDDLQRFGSRVAHEIDDLGRECEDQPPYLKPFNAWGERVDELITCNAWKKQHDITSEEGLVAIPYEKKFGHWSRLYQICKLYLYVPSSGLYSCPLAMTDGAAKALLKLNSSDVRNNREQFVNAYENLTSRNPEKFWTSGQWMTERKGGSDVAQSTETIAIPDKDSYRLFGYKWFSSASDANIALTLAKIVQNPKDLQDAGKTTLFYVETKNQSGKLNNIQLVKLKNKLGTRQLPTAELLLDGCIAHKISEEGRGIASISDMLNTTRLHNSIASVACMRRILQLSRNYSENRVAFGRTLSKIPLHMRILCNMEVEVRGSLLFMLKVAVLVGKTESGMSTADDQLLLRLLFPVLKLYTAKQAVAVVSEGLETFGGQGYIEDTGLPVFLRDAQVLPIWEGTTNVMSMDLIRTLIKTNLEALMSLEKSITLSLEVGKNLSELKESSIIVEKSIKHILHFVQNSPDCLGIAARDVAYSIARSYIGSLLIENAAATRNETDVFAAQQWCGFQDLCTLSRHQNYSSYVQNDFNTVMEGYKTS